MEENLMQRLDIIKSKLKHLKECDKNKILFGAEDHNYELGLPLEEEEIVQFEQEFGIEIPKEYRAFLKNIGDGGAGPGYGLYSLEQIKSELNNMSKNYLSKEFPLKKEWNKDISDDNKTYDFYRQGTITLSHLGCGYYHFFVLNGSERGSIWHDGRAGDFGISPLRVKFIQWYKDWIDYSIKRIDGMAKEINLLKRQFEYEEKEFSIINIKFPISNLKKVEIKIDFQFYPACPIIGFPSNEIRIFPMELSTIRSWDAKESSIFDILKELETVLPQKIFEFNFKNSLENLINSEEFYNAIKQNIVEFEKVFEDLSNNRISLLDYFINVAKILSEKRP